jgi:hypothetical protein
VLVKIKLAWPQPYLVGLITWGILSVSAITVVIFLKLIIVPKVGLNDEFMLMGID